MGILNVTPDSFSDGGCFSDLGRAVSRGREMEQEGADILDVGGQSTRPGSAEITEEEELRRVGAVLDALCPAVGIPVSIDTYRSRVAEKAIEAGVQIVNDISGLRFDPRMAEISKAGRAGVVLMFSRGRRSELHSQPPLEDPTGAVRSGLELLARDAVECGIPESAIAIDPGIGFGQRGHESLKVLRDLEVLTSLPYPILVGTSRKAFVGKILPETPDLRIWGTAASVVAAVLHGAHIVRVHDVGAMRAAVRVADAILKG
jgi:dihydropteroate synthase